MTPEEKARVKIDKLFQEAGWAVSRDQYTPALTAAAIKEGFLKGNFEADYFLFINVKAVGVSEAKRAEAGHSADAVVQQTVNYAQSVPPCYQSVAGPLPLPPLAEQQRIVSKVEATFSVLDGIKKALGA